ncbi:hypothetical protein GAO09_15920 [Rhizobiales bacterium RZME27]|jgi:hypothetical protein|uniref:Uncharacterized protein n=1 Tax=Endobacterium cereale TaxID=2663029 RepID=A0A6A8A8D5_9HYPH|nr:hypothetical protein [Endobacterium cereale]MEB2847061.1 hypothetical protein [Endobacterium cereale]MQY47522.1 hypothetical protein [Endobacterium cereale]
MQHSDDDRLVTVAIGYGFAETATTAAYLEAHGVPVTTLPYHLASISWDMVVALKGMEIRVPARLAGAACVLLAEIARPNVPDGSTTGWAQWGRRIALVLIFLITYVPPPPRGVFYLSRAEVVGSHP